MALANFRFADPWVLALLPAVLALGLLHRWRRGARLRGGVVLSTLAPLAQVRPGWRLRLRPLLVARYYVLTQASIAFGLYDWLRHGTEAGWEQAEGTR